MMRYIFHTVKIDTFRTDMKAVENEILSCIPFETDKPLLYDVLCEVRCLLSESPSSLPSSLI